MKMASWCTFTPGVEKNTWRGAWAAGGGGGQEHLARLKFNVNFGILAYQTGAWQLHLLYERRNDTRYREQDRPLFQQCPIRI